MTSLKSKRRGATIVVLAMVLPVLVVIVGFSVDLAYMQQVRTELRVATDLAAKAASSELSRTGDVDLATDAGKNVALANFVGGAPFKLDNSDFVFGRSIKQANGKWTFDSTGVPQNAVQVNGRRTQGSPGGPVDLFFSRFLRSGSFQPVTAATASFINVDICLVLDRSSSMKFSTTSTENLMSSTDPRFCDKPWADSRWTALSAAVSTFISGLSTSEADEHLALVTFASNFSSCGGSTPAARVDCGLAGDTSIVSSAMSLISNEIWNGATQINDGIDMGRTVLTGGGARTNAIKVMIVLTDGASTTGDPVAAAQTAANSDITIHTITYGAAADKDAMIAVAAAGGGTHYHAPNATTLDSIFEKIAGAITILTE